MTAVKKINDSSPPSDSPREDTAESIEVPAFPPSMTEAEAKSRFATALTSGVDMLRHHGYGRERISAELLRDLAEDCSPDDDEIFDTMASFGVSLDEATKLSTISKAYRQAMVSKECTIEAIDELTSRLSLAKLRHRHESSQPSGSSLSEVKMIDKLEKDGSSGDAVQSSPSAQSLLGHDGSVKSTHRSSKALRGRHRSLKGRKRNLTESVQEKSIKANDLSGHEAHSTNIEVKELMNSKISEEDEKKVSKDSSARAKTVVPVVPRGKRSSSLRGDETQPVKRIRTAPKI